MLVSDQADPQVVALLVTHVERCPACQALMEKRNRLYAAASFESATAEGQAGENSLPHEIIERFKTTPGLSRENRIGHFQVIRKLGEGGMGQVYECLDEKLNRRVAVKWIKTAHLSPQFLQRLEKEARIHARLNHPNIVPLLEFSVAEGMPYLVMELVDGGTLRGMIRDQKLGPVEAARLLAQVARGVQAAHDQGVLHCDLKPANILLKTVATAPGHLHETAAPAARFVPKVTDFGLAKVLDIISDETESLHLQGTPFYMAPEYFMGISRAIGPAADIYSLGVILYELLTGRVPFAGQNLGEVSELIVNQHPIAPRAIQAGVPLDLQTICLKCLEKLPALRYPSAAALADDLDHFLQNRPIQARAVGLAGKARRWARRNPAVALMIGVSTASVSLLVVSSVLFAYRQARLRQEAEDLRLQAQASERKERGNYQLIRDKYFRELETANGNYNGLRQIVDQGTQPDQVRDFYNVITQQRFDRALEMIKRPELLGDTSEHMVEAFYLAALQTQVKDQETAITLFRTAVDRAKAIAASRRLNPLGRFCALNSDNYMGVIAGQRGKNEESLACYRDGWEHFRLLPTENVRDARLKKFSLMIGQNLIEELTKLGRADEAEAVRRACGEIEKIAVEPAL